MPPLTRLRDRKENNVVIISLSLDLETYSDVDLKTCGVYRYAL